MVWSLEELLFVEDRFTLAGHIAAMLGNYDAADEFFSQSSDPRVKKYAALEMRRDVLHWDRALELAKVNAPAELPLISKDYAVQLEFL
jgi:WD repeat-containing protein 19